MSDRRAGLHEKAYSWHEISQQVRMFFSCFGGAYYLWSFAADVGACEALVETVE